MKRLWVMFTCALAASAGAQLPSEGRAAALMQHFQRKSDSIDPPWAYIRDPNIREEVAPAELEDAYTKALQNLARLEAARATADATFAAARTFSSVSGVDLEWAQAKALRAQDSFLDALIKLNKARTARNETLSEKAKSSCPVEGTLVQSHTVLVRFRDQAPIEEIDRVLDDHDLDVFAIVPSLSLFVTTLKPSIRGEESAIEHVLRLNRTVRELSAEPSVYSAVQQVPLEGLASGLQGLVTSATPSCWEWYSFATAGPDSARLIALEDAWKLVEDAGASQNHVAVTVLDQEFDLHNDFSAATELCAATTGPHGNQVRGMIMGTAGDAKFSAGALSMISTCGIRAVTGRGLCGRHAALTAVLESLQFLLEKHAQQIINISLGYNWGTRIRQPEVKPKIEIIVEAQGGTFRDLLSMYSTNALVVTSAGNDDDEAKWGSPMNWAALGPVSPQAATGRATNVAVVEAVVKDGTQWPSTNQGGSVAAPGVALWTCHGGSAAALDDGTSLSAPVVSGVAVLMFAIKPSLTPERAATLLATGRVVNARAAVEAAQREP